jgi:hypothetical protein
MHGQDLAKILHIRKREGQNAQSTVLSLALDKQVRSEGRAHGHGIRRSIENRNSRRNLAGMIMK